MTADDPRVQRARELAETYQRGLMDTGIEDALLESVHELLAVVDERSAALVDSHRRHLHTILRAEAAEAEVERLHVKLAALHRVRRELGGVWDAVVDEMRADQ